jgi:hypothetical protein
VVDLPWAGWIHGRSANAAHAFIAREDNAVINVFNEYGQFHCAARATVNTELMQVSALPQLTGRQPLFAMRLI